MTLTHRLLRRLGRDTTKEVEFEHPVYRYEIEHLNGVYTEDYAHEHVHDEGFLLLKDVPGVTWTGDSMIGLTPPFSYHSWDTVDTYEGIQEHSREQVGEMTWTCVVDKADGSVVEKDVETTMYEL
jgi:hypothetical protein